MGVGGGISSFSTSSEPCWRLAQNQMQEATWEHLEDQRRLQGLSPSRSRIWSLALWTVLLRCRAWGVVGVGQAQRGVVVLWAQDSSCGQSHCLFCGCAVLSASHLQMTKVMLRLGKLPSVTQPAGGQNLQKRTELFCHGECLCGEYSTLSW